MISSVMFFVDEPSVVCAWWARADSSPSHDVAPFFYLIAGDVDVGFHPSDQLANPKGSSCVVSLAVESLEESRAQLLSHGCSSYRGPLQVAKDRWIAQLVDPFGNVFGLEGPSGAPLSLN